MAAPNLYIHEEDKYYDTSFLINKNGEIIGKQKMVHVAQAPEFYEKDYYDPSNEGFKVFDTEYGKIGFVICFDRHYPESIRTESLMNADIILIPTANISTEPLELFKWEILVQTYQNSVAIAMCNRVGKEDNMNFAGESLVCDANGNIKGILQDKEDILYVNMNIKESRKIRESKPYTNLREKKYYL